MIKDLSSLAGRLRFPKRWVLTIGEKNSFSVKFSRSFSTGGIVAFFAVLLLSMAVVAGFLMVVSPLRGILPGYLGKSERRTLEIIGQRVDSMSVESGKQAAYMANLRSILTDDLPVEYVAQPVDSAGRIPLDSLLPMSETERKFIAEFESREVYNQSILTPIAAEGMVFQKPVSAILDLEESGKALNIRGTAGESVDAIYRGTVVAAYFDGMSGGTVVIQHPNEFLSVYSGLARIYVVRGEIVRTSSRLGTMDSALPILRLEIWYKGTEVSSREILGL